jgi:hypothetical protein
VELLKDQRAKAFEENEVVMKRSEKSLEKRRDFEQEQKGECSKYVQERAQRRESFQQEALIRLALNEHKENWKTYRKVQTTSSDSEEERFKIEKKNSVQKKMRSNERGNLNRQNYHINHNKSLDYIAQLMQNLEGKIRDLEGKLPDRS